MKALVFKGNKVSEFTDYADPTIDEYGVIVKVMANGVCRSDYSMWYSENPPNVDICGHEMTGIVEEVGKNIKNFKKDVDKVKCLWYSNKAVAKTISKSDADASVLNLDK